MAESKSKQYKARAIVLKTTKLGESDKILSLYSRDYGPIRAVAKGARKINSSFGSKAEVLTCFDALIAKGRNLDILTQTSLVSDFGQLKKNYESLHLAYYFVDIFEHIAVHDDSYEEPFELLYSYLDLLNTRAQEVDHQLLLSTGVAFLWDLLLLLGYKPNLSYCSLSQLEIAPNQIAQYYDFENGSICSNHAYQDFVNMNPYQDQIRRLDPETFRLLKDLDQEYFRSKQFNYQSAYVFKLETDLLPLFYLLHKHLSYRLHKEFKTWYMLEPLLEQPLAKLA